MDGMMKRAKGPIPACRSMALRHFLAGVMLGCLPLSAAGDGEGEAKKQALDVAAGEIVQLHTAQPANANLDDGKFVVSEYRVKGLWEELGMQLFRLEFGGWRSENYLAAKGTLTRLEIPTFGGAGLLEGAVHGKAFYLTSDWGSGILRTALYRIDRDQAGKIRTEELGVISSVGGQFDKKFLEDKTVKKVMTLLQPLKKGKGVTVMR
mgnify:CR=1 FL=1